MPRPPMPGLFRSAPSRFFAKAPQLSALLSLRNLALGLGLLAIAPLPVPHLHPVHAQTTMPDPGRETDQGISLLEEGAKLLLRGLMSEVEPGLKELEGAVREIGPQIGTQMEALGPQLRELTRMMKDVTNYEMPVMLENGDILIRRKAPLSDEERREELPQSPAPSPAWPPVPGPDGGIDL